MHQTKSKWRTFGKKYMGKFQHNGEACWIKKLVPTKPRHGMEPSM
jgi:hypothetical protein